MRAIPHSRTYRLTVGASLWYAGARYSCERTELVDRNVNRASKLLRAYTAQVEALSRFRGKGQQQIVVKHVSVNQGGQAIVGSVSAGSGGEVSDRNGQQPHTHGRDGTE